MSEEQKRIYEVFEELSKTLFGVIASHSETLSTVTEVERVKFYEMALIQEKLMAWSVGKPPEEKLYALPQILYQWKEFRKPD